MTQEEKVRAYNEALEAAKKFKESFTIGKSYKAKDVRAVFDTIFPELKESEDERIRNFLHHIFTAEYLSEDKLSKWHGEPVANILAWLEKQGKKETTYDEDMLGAIEYCKKNNRPLEKEHIAWLEKQSEQKPATWSKEDEQNLNACLGFIPDEFLRRWLTDAIHTKYDKPTEWSEEDEKIRKGLIKGLEDRLGFGWASDPFSREEYIDWLKSLRPQNTWKPSDEQIEVFEHFVKSIGESGFASPYENDTNLIYSLLSDLKKLKE